MKLSGLCPLPYQTATMAALLLLAPMVHCVTTPPAATLAQLLNERVKDPMDDSRAVPIAFVTNRRISGGAAGCADSYYTVERAAEVVFGECTVNVPRSHPVGALDEPDGTPNRHQHFTVTEYKPLSAEDYYARLDKDKGDILLFVHGFNVKFREAVLRAAQIGYDAKFQGTVLLFTWPAGAKPGLFSSFRMDSTYKENRENAAHSVGTLKTLLAKLAGTGRKVIIVAHSMGHQVTIPALAALADEGIKEPFSELVFTAPDFPEEQFRQLVPKLSKTGKRITLYCSPGDNALRASQRLNENRRIGQCGRVAGVDVINVNMVDSPVLGIGGLGHGYYSSRALLTDFFQLMLGMDVQRRLFIHKSNQNANEDYVLRN